MWQAFIAGLLALAAATTSHAMTLASRFDLGADADWAVITVPLARGPWRSETPQGRVATDAEVLSVLGRLTSLTIGARCTSVREGDLTYPCGFALSEPDLGGLRDTDPERMLRGWRGTLGYAVRGRFDVDGPPTVMAFDAPDTPPPGESRDQASGSSRRFIGFSAPPALLGDRSGAFGRTLSFRFRAVADSTARSDFDPASGVVLISNDPPRGGAEPQRVDRIPVVVASLERRGNATLLAYALGTEAPVPEQDDHRQVEGLLGQWVSALNARSLDDLASVYHPNARLFDGQPVFGARGTEGLWRHLTRTADAPSWRLLRYRIVTDTTGGHVDAMFTARTSVTTDRTPTEHGHIRLNLTRDGPHWRMLSHGPWSRSLLGP